MPLTQAQLLTYLAAQSIPYDLHEHPPVFTVEEAQTHTGHIRGVHCKNLFLKDQKTDALFLVTVPDERMVDLKSLPEKLGAKKFSFGKPDLLMEVLGVMPGSVTPFGLINDTARRVQPVLDRWMMQEEWLNVHPLVNTATVTIKPQHLLNFINKLGYQPIVLGLDS